MNRAIEEQKELTISKDLGDSVIKNCWIKPSGDANLSPTLNDRNSGRIVRPLSPDLDLAMILKTCAEEARDFICISSFLIQKSAFTDAVLKAMKRGVRCYILTAREEELKEDTEEMDNKEKARIIAEHVELLSSFVGAVLVRTAPHFHAKFALFDPLSEDAVGYVATCNLTQGAMRGDNVEYAARLAPQEIRSYYHQFVHGFWNESKHEMLEKGVLSDVKGFNHPMDLEIDHPCTTTDRNSIRTELLKLIGSAKQSITIGAWTIERDHLVTNKLAEASSSGIRVHVITRPRDLNTPTAIYLHRSGAEVAGVNRFHVKVAIADGENGMLFTSNISKRGLDESFESGIFLSKKESKILDQELLDLMRTRGWYFRESVKLRDVKSDEVKCWVEGGDRFYDLKIEDERILPSEKETVPLKDYFGGINGEHRLVASNEEGERTYYRSLKKHITWSPETVPTKVEPIPERSGKFLVVRDKKNSRYVPVAFIDDVDEAIAFADKQSAKAAFAPQPLIEELKGRLDKIIMDDSKKKGKGPKMI